MIAWFARNGVAANLLLLLILAIGAWSLKERIPLEVFPSLQGDTIHITLPYPGASPSEVEKAVVVRAEEAIADLEGIKKINSSAYEGIARLTLELEDGFKPRELINDVKSNIDAITTFPDEVDSAEYGVAVLRQEVVSLAVSGALSEIKLRHLSEQIRDELAALPQISYIELSGIREYEIAIEVAPHKLEQASLTLSDVVAAIRKASIDVPAGSIKSNAGEILLRSTHTAESIDTIGNIRVRSQTDGSELKLKDLAALSDGFAETVISTQFNGKSAIIIEVYRSGTQSALKVAEAVKNYVQLKQAKLPAGIALNLWRDRSKIVKLRLQTLLKSAWQGGLLVFICLALFLRLSVALWVCVGIPSAFMGAMIVMPTLGVSLNIISLFAFILVLGVVVDDAIITGENVYKHLKKSKNGLQAAIDGTREVAVPVTFGMLTTVAAFLPLLFIDGFRGKIFAQIALIVMPVLAFSWVESKLILPAHLSHIKPYVKEKSGLLLRAQQSIAAALEWLIEKAYQPILRCALRQRYLTFALFIGFSFLVMAYVISGRFGFTFFPKVESETARATLTMPAGTPAAATIEQITRIEAAALALQTKYTDPNTAESVVKNILSSVGWRTGGGSSAGGDAEIGQVSLELMAPEIRTLNIGTRQLVQEWREAVGSINTAKELSYRAEIGRGGEPVAIALIGNNTAAIKQVSALVKQRLSQYPGLFDIQDSLADGKTQLQITLKESAAFLGINAKQLGEQLRHAYYGLEVQRLQRGRDDVRVMVRFPEQYRNSLASLERLQIRTDNGVLVPLSSVANFTFEQGAAAIKREDRKRHVIVSADADKAQINANKIAADLSAYLDGLLDEYPDVSYELAGELKEQGESFGSLQYGILLALFAIYSLLAIPLKSYTQPLVVMLVIPFSTIGAILGHSLLGMSLSMMSILGMLALAGVAVNDSLVLVHWINKQRHAGLSTFAAASAAGAARFRPILLTSITTFFGLSPLLLEKSTQAQFLIPMAVSLGFGILYATVLSLLLIPCAYVILDDCKRAYRWLYPLAAA